MKKTTIILSALFIILNIFVYAQTGGVVIANGAATADGSAMLDVQSTTKGMLVPRMTESEKNTISPVATGLMIYQTDGTAGFYFYDGTAWTAVVAGALGINDLTDGKTGNQNTSLGENAGSANTTGIYNTATGALSLHSNTAGNRNMATGHESLYWNTTGDNNTAAGYHALVNNTIGYDNTAVGREALVKNTIGNRNTAVGRETLYYRTDGDYNTGIGFGASVISENNTINNSTAIGSNAIVYASNTVRLGNPAVTSIGGQVGWTTVSDGRFKTNLKENVAGLDFIMKLRPLTYHFDMDALASFNKTPDNSRHAESEKLQAEAVQIGFIAQEVEEAATELGFDFHGVDKPKNENSHYGLRYAEFVVPLVKAMQEQQAIIAQQQTIIAQQHAVDEQQQALISQQQDLLSKYESTLEEMNNRMEMLEAKVSGQHSEKYVAVK